MTHLIYQCLVCSHHVAPRYDDRGYDAGVSRIEQHIREVHPDVWERLMREVYAAQFIESEMHGGQGGLAS